MKTKAKCKRCGKAFTPKPTKLKTIKITRCCDECQVRNLFDGLDLPTPPELLDRYTKHPTLSEREFKKMLAADDDVEDLRHKRKIDPSELNKPFTL